MRTRTKIKKDEYCHIYLRGIEKKDIFIDESDYLRFLKLINHCNKKNSIAFSTLIRKKKEEISNILNEKKEELSNIIIGTLMPNHFHILVKCVFDGSIGKYMQKVLNSYAKYFNNKYAKKGYRFENKYQYRKITDEYDLKNTINYIYNNSAKLYDKNYDHKDYISGKYKMTKEQKLFVKKYPYTFKGKNYNEYK